MNIITVLFLLNLELAYSLSLNASEHLNYGGFHCVIDILNSALDVSVLVAHVDDKNIDQLFQKLQVQYKSGTEIVTATTESEDAELTKDMQILLKSLSERKRRSFLRYMSKKPETNDAKQCNKEDRQNELMDKLKCISLENEDNFDISDGDVEDSD